MLLFDQMERNLRSLLPKAAALSEQVDGEFSGEELVVAFNPTYLLEGVEAIRSDTLVLEVIDSSKPATVRGEDEDDYRYLLMPVRVT